MSLIDNLNAIENCKNDIKNALINKGVNMTGVAFSGYAGKINALQLESGDSPAPTPSADYMYSNGYLTDAAEANDIITFIPYEIVLNDEGKFIIELMCPEEIPGYEGGTYFDVIFTVDIPVSYRVSKFEYYDQGTTTWYDRELKPNPRHSTVIRDGVTYYSYVRVVSDGVDIGSVDVQFAPFKYRITIEK